MLLEYLQENYKEDEPIFVADVELPVKDNNLRQMFKVLCDRGEIKRFDKGIYYFEKLSKLKGGANLSAREVARYKYIERRDRIDGYYSGYTFANQLGVTLQVPFMIEIVSNYASAKCREVHVKNQKIILRKPRVEVTRENAGILQMLDFLKDWECYIHTEDATERMLEYVERMQVKRSEVDRYIGLYPDRVYRYIYEMKVYERFVE